MSSSAFASACAVAALVSLSASGAAHANVYDFTFTQGTFMAAQGTITTSDTAGSDGGFTVTGITGEIQGNAIQGLDQPGGELFANDPSQLLDENGIFVDVPNAFLASPFNFFYFPEDFGSPVGVQNYQLGTPFFGSLGGDFQITPAGISAAPEPSAWLLMIAGIGGVGLMLRRARESRGLPLKDALAA
jgi:PEP-CTERM motif